MLVFLFLTGIVQYMKNEAGPSSLYLNSLLEVDQFRKSPLEPRAVGFFSAYTSAAIVEAFSESGNLMRQELKLAHTTNATIAKEMLFPVDSVVVFHPQYLVSKFEAGFSVISDIEGDDSESLAKRYYPALRPLVGQMTKANMLTIYQQRPLLVAYYDMNWDKDYYKGKKVLNLALFSLWHTV